MQTVAPPRPDRSGSSNPLPRTPPKAQAESPFNRMVSWLLGFVVAITLNGYPLAGLIAALLGTESTEVTYPYRALSTGLALALSAIVLARGRFSLDPLMTFFLCAYAIRLYYDLTYTSLPDVGRAMVMFIITVVVPFFTVSICRYYYANRRTLMAFLIISGPAVVLLTFLGASTLGPEDSSRFGLDALNPVSVGYTGLYCLVAIFFLWGDWKPAARYLILAPLALGSVYVMLIANARGAAVGFALCVAALSARRGTTLAALGVFIVAVAILFGDTIAELNLFQRLARTGSDVSSMDRIDRMRSSIELMVANPMFGFGYMETKFYSFPHNLLIESGLALGYGGLAIMAYLQARYAILIRDGLRGNAQFIALLGLIGLSSAWLSSTLWASINFWTPMALLVALAAEQNSQRRRGLFRSGRVGGSRRPMQSAIVR